MFALPSYLLSDILRLQEALDKITYQTEFMSFNLKSVPVFWDGDTDKVGEFRYQDGEYVFWITQDTLDGISEGHR